MAAMIKRAKRNEMKQWLSSQPDKTPKDWLLECRCREADRKKMTKLLTTCDELGIKFEIPKSVFSGSNDYTKGEEFEFDIAFNGGYFFDMDTPRDIFESNEPRHRKAIEYLSWKTGEPRTDIVEKAPLTYAMYKNNSFFENYFCDWQSDDFLENLKIDSGIIS